MFVEVRTPLDDLAAGLTFGDWFSYALAGALGEPLLFKGEDFWSTDGRVWSLCCIDTRNPASSNQGVPARKSWEAGEVAIYGPQFPNPMLQARRRNSGIVQLGANKPNGIDQVDAWLASPTLVMLSE